MKPRLGQQFDFRFPTVEREPIHEPRIVRGPVRILAVLVARTFKSFEIDGCVIFPTQPVNVVPPIIRLLDMIDVLSASPWRGWLALARMQVFPSPFDDPACNAPVIASRDLDLACFRPHPDYFAHNGHVVMARLDCHVDDADLFRPIWLAVAERFRERLAFAVARHDVVVALSRARHFLAIAAPVRRTPAAVVRNDLRNHFVSEHLHLPPRFHVQVTIHLRPMQQVSQADRRRSPDAPSVPPSSLRPSSRAPSPS